MLICYNISSTMANTDTTPIVSLSVGDLDKYKNVVKIVHALGICSQRDGSQQFNGIRVDGCSHDLAYPCYWFHNRPDSNSVLDAKRLKLAVLTNIGGPVMNTRTFTEEEKMKIDISPCHRTWSKLFDLLSNEHGPLSRGYLSGINQRGQLGSFLPYLASRNNIIHSNR